MEALINLTKSYKEVKDKLVLELRVVQDTPNNWSFLIVFPNIILCLGARTIFESTLFLLDLTVLNALNGTRKKKFGKPYSDL